MRAQEDAARALWNLAALEDNQATIAAFGAIGPLTELLSEGSPAAQEAAAWALRNLAANADNQARAPRSHRPPSLQPLRY